mmetsp:Transcript_23582/g.36279  ORF Transcript_23582/g.36279 Transcript_23582/m.36279 type:complete len:176 (-) Transcript_23582:3796-4323(-)
MKSTTPGDKGEQSSKNAGKRNLRVNVNKATNSHSKGGDGSMSASDNDPFARNEESAWGIQAHMKKSPHSLIKMSKRILELRNENMVEIQTADFSSNLQKLKKNILLIRTRNQDSYASRQLLPFLRSLFAERQDEEMNASTQILKERFSFQSIPQVDMTAISARRFLRNKFEAFVQ